MSKNRSPLDRLWHGALLIFGIVVMLWLALQILSEIYGWLLLIGMLVAVGGVLLHWRRYRRDRW